MPVHLWCTFLSFFLSFSYLVFHPHISEKLKANKFISEPEFHLSFSAAKPCSFSVIAPITSMHLCHQTCDDILANIQWGLYS